MHSSPSIVPGIDQDVYLVVDDFGHHGQSWRESNVGDTDRETVVCDLLEGQLLGDTETLLTSLHKTNYNSVLVRLASPDSLDTFKKALTTNPALSVSVERHSD